ncbi:MAG: hypothetical protein KGS09_13210 [Nitrospirae bacterium]|nr:hypothetical protein [Nitrospirota bacterium]MBU6481490.1 hypothetical protein [Nitrospirota bacterium]MDE3052019.1 hypothetical protein [Nitrospirota bacterium]
MGRQNSMNDSSKDGQPFGSQAEMISAMQDPRYRSDRAYEARVVARVAVTDGSLAGENKLNRGNVINEVDQVATHMPEGLQTVGEFAAIMRSHKYKTNPAYRLAIEGAVAAATPNWQPRSDDQSYRVQFTGEDDSSKS